MVTGLLDTSILVDVLRGYQPAEDWLATQAPIPRPLAPTAWEKGRKDISACAQSPLSNKRSAVGEGI